MAPAEWLLPDDGIVDPIAVEIAASGERMVRLTAAERREAAALIVARGGTAYLVAKRLGMSGTSAYALLASLAAGPQAAVGDAA